MPFALRDKISKELDRLEKNDTLTKIQYSIEYASRTLTAAEKKTLVVTDHKLLLRLFKEDRQIPSMAALKIQRWAVTLSAYEYSLSYRAGKLQANCDGLSRLPDKDSYKSDPPVPAEILL